jgi:nitric oxide reductase large subunit
VLPVQTDPLIYSRCFGFHWMGAFGFMINPSIVNYYEAGINAAFNQEHEA